MLGIVLGTRDTAVNETDTAPASLELVGRHRDIK